MLKNDPKRPKQDLTKFPKRLKNKAKQDPTTSPKNINNTSKTA